MLAAITTKPHTLALLRPLRPATTIATAARCTTPRWLSFTSLLPHARATQGLVHCRHYARAHVRARAATNSAGGAAAGEEDEAEYYDDNVYESKVSVQRQPPMKPRQQPPPQHQQQQPIQQHIGQDKKDTEIEQLLQALAAEHKGDGRHGAIHFDEDEEEEEGGKELNKKPQQLPPKLVKGAPQHSTAVIWEED